MAIIREDWDNLTPGQLKVAQYVTRHLQEVLISTEQEIALEAGVSIATVSRFWRAAGHRNLKAFKAAAKKEVDATPAAKIRRTQKEDALLPLEKGVALLQETRDHMDDGEFNEAVALLLRARRVYVLANGPSRGLGELLIYRLKRLGIDIRLLAHQGNELFEDVIHLEAEDAVLMFSFGRLLAEAKVLLDCQRRQGFGTIVITDRLIPSIHGAATLYASRGEASEFHSMIGPVYLIEKLILHVGQTAPDPLSRLEELSSLRKTYQKELPR
ncbi:RpiR family transcriptional regulator [Bhargavaea cecembensis]|uniref:RpiR family transcriptional regulator n=1 Tax=Bhargavaea cecembensis TaxID=394098 RepID=A0A163ET96_9BACL|nr:MurR/RpiR family transcriptional regulator [Bhargavaea cecembensis]KZE37137.1 RpiR family transcriptional regulator [Bhargavaea cecembensis]